MSCRLIEDIAKLLPPGSRAFEFGSGCSTHALRCAFGAVLSLEHSTDWLERTEADPALPKRTSDEIEFSVLKRKCGLI